MSSNIYSAATLFQDVSEALEIQAGQTANKVLYMDDDVRVVLFGFAAGQELAEHTATVPAMLQFISGSASVTLGEKTIEAAAGTFAHMPAHLPHSISAKTDTVMMLTMLKGAKTSETL